MSSPFPIAIPNGTSFFLSLVQEKLDMPSGLYYRLCSWSVRSNHVIKKFHCTFPISFKLIHQVYLFSILIRQWKAVGTSFFRTLFTFLYTRASPYLLCLSHCLISFLLFPCSSVSENTCTSSPFPIAMLNGIFLFRETTWSKWSKGRLPKTNYTNNTGTSIKFNSISFIEKGTLQRTSKYSYSYYMIMTDLNLQSGSRQGRLLLYPFNRNSAVIWISIDNAK